MREKVRRVDPERAARIRKRRRREKLLRCMVVVLLCAGVAVQTVLIIRLAGTHRESVRIESEIDRMNSEAVNYRLAIGSNGDRKALKNRALTVLGMVEPGPDQIRVVQVQSPEDTQAQKVMNDVG